MMRKNQEIIDDLEKINHNLSRIYGKVNKLLSEQITTNRLLRELLGSDDVKIATEKKNP